jgi:hypothetical protein
MKRLPLVILALGIMLVAVGTEVPQPPGIYIHQGKKIVVR